MPRSKLYTANSFYNIPQSDWLKNHCIFIFAGPYYFFLGLLAVFWFAASGVYSSRGHQDMGCTCVRWRAACGGRPLSTTQRARCTRRRATAAADPSTRHHHRILKWYTYCETTSVGGFFVFASFIFYRNTYHLKKKNPAVCCDRCLHDSPAVVSMLWSSKNQNDKA